MKHIIIALFLFAGFSAKAQHDGSDQIKSANWSVIGKVEFQLKDDNSMLAIFTPEIKKLANKPFELEGYIVPIKSGMKQTKFMLSTLPINQCYFCGQNGIPAMILVELAAPIKFSYNPVTIKGILKLNTGNTLDNPAIALTEGKSI
ncbi:DUF3299 domain-containing protein [Pedobacter sp. MC2016-14]|uniref:DUF3299 domain-containing protein n=1 Tax=Pedobacter sp. MC2016-14 TaxID=2897327 RepID=UPI001E345F6B|nr:DUF3299 domain-containing protein [Pedobacter sp. MC2016-14]MCD0488658.1 DUF3299 domain-containing protein [Pedobacter sp. MC2016-14]